MPDTILPFDLGNYKGVACLYDRATAAADFRTAPPPGPSWSG